MAAATVDLLEMEWQRDEERLRIALALHEMGHVPAALATLRAATDPHLRARTLIGMAATPDREAAP